MDDEFYYLALSVKDRIIEECVAKYGNLKRASLEIFDGSIWLYRDDSFPKINAVLKVCQACDVSFDYIMTGKNKQSFKPLKESYSNLIREYSNAGWHKNPLDKSANVILFRLKHGTQKTLSLPFFIKMVCRYKKLPSYLAE
jgi:hypothetical protein